MKKIPNLDTLRFVAASLVIIHHVELYKSFFSLPNCWTIPFFEIIGKLGVVLFFVLSGFLITTLLLNEKEKNKKILFKNFYMRRILRIWPVYYLVVFFGFFVYPNISFFDIPSNIFPAGIENIPLNIIFYLTIFANLGWAVFGNVPYTSQTWSLATEEQFYLLWPLVINIFNKRLIIVLLSIILGYYIVKLVLISPYVNLIPFGGILSNFWSTFNINCMAIGGAFSLIIFKKSKLVDFIFNKMIFYPVVILTISLLATGCEFGFFHYDIYAVLFGIIISNLAFNPHLSKVLEYKVTNYLGTISYGMYMYHFVALTIAIRIGIYVNTSWIIYPMTFLITILISHISYKYFESYFLRLKAKF